MSLFSWVHLPELAHVNRLVDSVAIHSTDGTPGTTALMDIWFMAFYLIFDRLLGKNCDRIP